MPYPKFEIRFGWVVLLALLLQIIVIYVGFGEAGVIRRFIFPSSYLLLLAFVVLNRRRIGFLVIGAGMLLNFLAIVSNGGLMPVTPEHLQESELAELEPGGLSRGGCGQLSPWTAQAVMAEVVSSASVG